VDEIAGLGVDDVVAEQRAHPPFEHEGVLVLARVAVQRRREAARGHRVLHEREPAVAGLVRVDHEAHADRAERAGLAVARPDDLRGGKAPIRARGPRGGQQATRARIAAAACALHEEVGVARTTVADMARRAGVQRLTVYNHFPDLHALLPACSAHWLAEHPPPDLGPGARALVALALDFWTWDRLDREGLDDAAAAALMTEAVGGTGG
jgi:Bacterial regulatory proteins, tetR family